MTEMQADRVLLVDDDTNLLSAMRRQLHNKFFLDTAASAVEGFALLKNSDPYGVIICDMQMPVCNGLQFLTKTIEISPLSVRLMLTGSIDQETATKAINQAQVYRFLKKPCDNATVEAEINNALNYYKVQMLEKDLLEKTLVGSVSVLVEIITAAHPREFQLAQRVREELTHVCQALHYEHSWTATMAALLLPLGMLLNTGGRTEPITSQVIAEKSASMLRKIPRLSAMTDVITAIALPVSRSHELPGGEIPYESRLLRILYDLLTLEAIGKPRSLALRMLMNTTGIYDSHILEELAAHYAPHIVTYSEITAEPAIRVPQRDLSALNAKQEEPELGMSIMVSVSELLAGDVLVEPMIAMDGSLLLDPGHVITEANLNRLNMLVDTRGIREPICIKVTTEDLAPTAAA